MMDLMPSDFTAVNSTLPACAMIPNQQNFIEGTMSDSTSQPSSRAAKSGKFALLSRAIKHSDIHLEVLFLQSSKSYEYFFCFHRTLGISPKDLEGFKADIVFIYTTNSSRVLLTSRVVYQLLLFKFHTLYEIRFSDWLICTTWHWVMRKQLP